MKKSAKGSKKKRTNWVATIGISLILTALVFLVWLLLRGETTVTGGWTEETDESLSCEAANMAYPPFEQENMLGGIRVSAIFNSDSLRKISLLYKTKFDSPEALSYGRVSAARALEENLVRDGFSNTALGATYTDLDDNIFQMSLYADGGDINNSKTYRYFMLGTNGVKTYTLDYMRDFYEKAGFTCTIKQ